MKPLKTPLIWNVKKRWLLFTNKQELCTVVCDGWPKFEQRLNFDCMVSFRNLKKALAVENNTNHYRTFGKSTVRDKCFDTSNNNIGQKKRKVKQRIHVLEITISSKWTENCQYKSSKSIKDVECRCYNNQAVYYLLSSTSSQCRPITGVLQRTYCLSHQHS